VNRLIHEKSPYLLQHAENPVDWNPWGEEAFQKAKQEDKPIFLSIGYSTCHWCHVMEEESFEDSEVAEIMNRHFISIKVDREERPDIDSIYMNFVSAMTGSGGWPLTVFLTPEGKPFFGGTYFPPDDKWGKPGLKTLLNSIASKWLTNKKDILTSSESLTRSIQANARQKADRDRLLDDKTLKVAYQTLESQFDETHGGFGSAPKFPRPHSVSFLLRYWKRTGEPRA